MGDETIEDGAHTKDRREGQSKQTRVRRHSKYLYCLCSIMASLSRHYGSRVVQETYKLSFNWFISYKQVTTMYRYYMTIYYNINFLYPYHTRNFRQNYISGTRKLTFEWKNLMRRLPQYVSQKLSRQYD